MGKKRVANRGFLGVDLEKHMVNSQGVGKLYDGNEVKSEVVELDGDKKCVDTDEFLDLDLVKGVENLQDGGKLCNGGEGKDAVEVLHEDEKCEDDMVNVLTLDDVVDKTEISSRKRKRESMLKMLNWVSKVAKNPCDHVIGSLPESLKWKSYGNEEPWKQVLLVREAIILKRVHDSSAEKSWQKNQKMHPCMYEDDNGSSYNLRKRLGCRKELFSGKSTSQPQACSESPSSRNRSDLGKSPSACVAGVKGYRDSSSANSLCNNRVPIRIPVGLSFQAEVPEWTGVASESDSKWLGTRVWPPEKEFATQKHRLPIERDYIGKGRQDSCGCEVPGSVECVRFHIAAKRLRLKHELGIAFHHWKFDKMGEEVSLYWTWEQEKKFKAIMKQNPPSLDICFWDELSKVFLKKKWEDLVSYYYNVFLIGRRGYQNRFSPNDIDSDDDESRAGLLNNNSRHEPIKSSISILYSPKKQCSGFRYTCAERGLK